MDALVFTCSMTVVAMFLCVIVLWEQILMSFITVKHADFSLYGNGTKKTAPPFYERFLLWWHSLKFPKLIITIILTILAWLASILCIFIIQEGYEEALAFCSNILIMSYFLYGSLMCALGVHLSIPLSRMGGSGDAHNLRLRILLLSIPASCLIILRGLYFAFKEYFFYYETHEINAVELCLLGLLTENLPCVLLVCLMWPMPIIKDDNSMDTFSLDSTYGFDDPYPRDDDDEEEEDERVKRKEQEEREVAEEEERLKHKGEDEEEEEES